MGLRLECEVHERLQGKHHLQPVFSGGCYDITRRLQEYDKNLFIVWNSRRKKYEVHSLGHVFNTYACDVPGNRLDARVEDAVRRGDIRVRGGKVFIEIDEHNERLEKSNERSWKTTLEGVAEEMHPYFRKVAWEGM